MSLRSYMLSFITSDLIMIYGRSQHKRAIPLTTAIQSKLKFHVSEKLFAPKVASFSQVLFFARVTRCVPTLARTRHTLTSITLVNQVSSGARLNLLSE